MAFLLRWVTKPREARSLQNVGNKNRSVHKLYKAPVIASLRISNKSLIFITPNGCCRQLEKLEKICTDAITAGVSAIQLRDLESSVTDFRRAARRLVDLVDTKCLLVINRDIKLALEIGASGVHFAEYQLRIDDTRAKEMALHSSQLVVGISVHSVSSALVAIEWFPSYIQVGSLFPTASHPGQEPLGLVRLREIRQVIPSNIQLVAVGGIRLENIHKLKNEGIDNVAVISAIADSPNRIEYCRSLKRQLE